ncbi:hypothetical protein JTE90_028089 [Oedothorax gibbosus]|uniref:Uncharacterized protein n=1 Tax=Oedothorax gibbosus TaxID=931172 RepID=A0AAV6V913_9ARAC|nr:hypothetical protein JTE90_028089 [Oedothorax gibbosus]
MSSGTFQCQLPAKMKRHLREQNKMQTVSEAILKGKIARNKAYQSRHGDVGTEITLAVDLALLEYLACPSARKSKRGFHDELDTNPAGNSISYFVAEMSLLAG